MKSKEIQLSDIWNDEKRTSLKEFITTHSQKQSKEQKLKNELLAIQFKIEDYISSERVSDPLRIIDFIKLYLKTLNVSQKKLAELFEMKDSNLHKYLVGERKLNTDILLKLSSFSNLNPEYWLRVEIKNELFEINKEKDHLKYFEKYSYHNLLAISDH
ncbi:helix-turn-helix domain-containing protein [Dyadobacter sp. CY347]|uniref:helix-turn-helix transcriptional regulator n=1 Tax=Dyadobacter sp. CY347 TaxID=2909336 RepID=UPI001F313451|nr:helix-turn-helix domain-containing protein [Dyadobacter sp. CY347]MCF2489201.1 helix-turn-helix transcriptional regulator [Dyadobacter sp. CY347]